jgi:hypothetical protein
MWAAVLAVVGLGGAMASGADRVSGVFGRMAAAVNAGDAQAYASLYAPDAVITIHGSARLEGREAIERYEIELLRQYPGAQLAFYSLWLDWPVAVVHYAVNGRTPSGQSMGHEGLLFYRFQESGLVEEERRYQDSLTPMAQLGLLGPVAARPVPALPARMAAYVARGSAAESANVATVTALVAGLNARNGRRPPRSPTASSSTMAAPRTFHGQDGWRAAFGAWTPSLTRRNAHDPRRGRRCAGRERGVGTLKGPLGRFAPDRATVHHGAIVLE